MITRAQAEALLTLAESLEACQKLDVHLTVPGRGEMVLCYGPCEENLDLSGDELSPFYLRLTVKALIPGGEFSANLIQKRFPKQET